MKRWSLKAQIITLVMSLVVVGLAVLGGLTYTKIKNQLHNDLDQKALSLALLLVDNVGPGLEFQDSVFVANIVQGAFTDEDVQGVSIYGPDTNLVFERIHDESLRQLVAHCNVTNKINVEHIGDFLLVEAPIRVHGEYVGCLWLAASEVGIAAETRDSLIIILLTVGAILIVAVGVGVIVAHRILRPIRTFEIGASRVGFGDMLSPIETGQLPDDFIGLGNAFNEMQAALRDAFTELARSRDQAEIQVAERTRELKNELTVRKKAEKELQFTQFSVDHAADAAFWMGPDARFKYVNLAACRQLGYTREELLRMSVFDIDNVLTRIMWPEHWDELRQRGSFTIESVYQRKDGSTLPVELTVNFMEFGGAEYNCAFSRDLTEKKKAEERRRELQDQLERAQRMESLGVLAGGVAHDLNNMLGPVVGYTELMLLGMGPEDKMRKRVERIARSAKGAADVIQDLLALARRGRYEMSPVCLNEVVAHYIDSPAFIQLAEKQTNIELVKNLHPHHKNIIGSEPHLSKVVMNLIVNAFDAMPDGGRLTISTEIRYIENLSFGHTQMEPGMYVILCVRDTGAGISPEDMDRIFEPYYSKKKMGRSGSGLGLSVVYGIVKDHKGYYEVKSEPGEGTEFSLYFPATNVQSKDRSVSHGQLAGTERVIVVDDDAEQRLIASELLTSLGYQVETLSSGSEAVECLRTGEVDLVVLDMIMEDGFDGLDTYREILKFKPTQRAIIVSGYSSTDRVQIMQSLGAGGYVRKPFTRQSLALAIRNEIDRTELTVNGG